MCKLLISATTVRHALLVCCLLSLICTPIACNAETSCWELALSESFPIPDDRESCLWGQFMAPDDGHLKAAYVHGPLDRFQDLWIFAASAGEHLIKERLERHGVSFG